MIALEVKDVGNSHIVVYGNEPYRQEQMSIEAAEVQTGTGDSKSPSVLVLVYRGCKSTEHDSPVGEFDPISDFSWVFLNDEELDAIRTHDKSGVSSMPSVLFRLIDSLIDAGLPDSEINRVVREVETSRPGQLPDPDKVGGFTFRVEFGDEQPPVDD